MSFIDTIQKLEPSIIAVGYDQEKIEEEVSEIVEKLGLNIQIVKIDRFGPLELSSSSKIKKKILNEWK
jgi:glycerol-3-phosphate cytidylyltransferase-like family protein